MNAKEGDEGARETKRLRLIPCETFSGMRGLAWHDNVLYASRGYELMKAKVISPKVAWEFVGQWHPEWWRKLTSRTRLSFRLVRDGFHALAVMPSGTVIAAVPGAIVTLSKGDKEFRVTYRVHRGTRPLHIVATPDGRAYWGEYFDNAEREEVYIYGSSDDAASWYAAHAFPRGAIRHVHNVVYDRWSSCLWVLTGDYGEECRVLRASPDFGRVETVLSGNQQSRAVAAVPAKDGLYFASDTPLETNFVYRMDRHGSIHKLSPLTSSSIYGCSVGDDAFFFSTMVEPSRVNRDQSVRVFGSRTGGEWLERVCWKKDLWSMRFFQYGNAFLPDGENTSGYLAVSTAAVEGADQTLSLFRVE
jgi:hypothetical protein